MRIFWTSIVILVVVLDQFSKWLTITMLPLQQQIPVLPFLSLYRTYNEGIAFSMLAGLSHWFLIAMTLAIMGFVLWLWRNLERDRFISALGYALVLGGAAGNLIDRIWLGKVIDMIFFHIDAIGFQFAIFNLADTFITLGAAAIIVDEFLLWKRGSVQTEDTQNE